MSKILSAFLLASWVVAAQAGFDDSFIYNEIELPLDRRHTPIEALLPEEAAETFQAWNDQADKIEY